MGSDLFPTLQGGSGVVRVQTIQWETRHCPLVEDDQELEIFNDVYLGDIGQGNDLDGFS